MSMKLPSLPMTGGCPCGAVRYEVASFPLLLYTCNCTDCQKASGSAFALNMPVRASDLRILRGKASGWHHTSPKGVRVTSWFCADCGGRLYGERAGRADSRRNARRHIVDDPGGAFLPAQRAALGAARSQRRLLRDPAGGLQAADARMACDVAGILPVKIIPF